MEEERRRDGKRKGGGGGEGGGPPTMLSGRKVANSRQMSIFSQSLSLFISPLILNYGGTNWGRVWGTGQKSSVIFFCWCEIHIFGIAVFLFCHCSAGFLDFCWCWRDHFCWASDCIWKKKWRNVSGSSVGCFECFWFRVWTQKPMPSTEAMLMTENQAMRIPGTLSTSPGRWLGTMSAARNPIRLC